MDYKNIVGEVLRAESQCLLDAQNRINGDEWAKIVDEIIESRATLAVLGVGKSGLIGAKIAATLASTGTRSIFIHPTEAMHGDLGMIEADSIALVISYSGESDEVIALMPHLRRRVRTIITMTKSANSTISALGDYFIDISVVREACPLDTAPTSSTTLTLALGDALAVCLMKKRDFTREDFAEFHPGGSLGKRLFVRIKDLMQTQNLPIISPHTALKDAIIVMTNGKLGNVLIAEDSKLVAVLSDGDLRRAMMRENFNLNDLAIDYATRNPRYCDDENTLAYDILRLIENTKIQLVVITDKERKIKGVAHLHKLIEAGIK